MTTNRAHAYGRVINLIAELGPAKLHASEQQAIRDAADALLFCSDIASDEEARKALETLESLVDSLVTNDRLILETAGRLLDAVEACGPQTEPLALPMAA